MALEHPQMMTVEEYFHLEETDTENHYEYIDGQVYMMAGGTFDHSTISGNIYSLLRGLLRGKPCRVYNSDNIARLGVAYLVHIQATNKAHAFSVTEVPSVKPSPYIAEGVVLLLPPPARESRSPTGGKFRILAGTHRLSFTRRMQLPSCHDCMDRIVSESIG